MPANFILGTYIAIASYILRGLHHQAVLMSKSERGCLPGPLYGHNVKDSSEWISREKQAVVPKNW